MSQLYSLKIIVLACMRTPQFVEGKHLSYGQHHVVFKSVELLAVTGQNPLCHSNSNLNLSELNAL